jgi:CRP/FNR family cyclic AMP-dependent transcriptional regulator
MMDTRPDGSATVLRFLRSQPLFEGISQASLGALARTSRFKTVPKGTFLFFQVDNADAVYVVRRGAIAIQLESPDGRELIINEMSRGDCLGELAILTGQPRSTSAEAILDSEVLCIPRGVFLAILEKELPFVRRLLEITAGRLQDSSEREEALAFHDAEQRLAGLLLAVDAATREKGYVSLSHEELARRAGLSRQTVSTILGRWRRRGWLLTGRGHIVLLNHRELKLLTRKLETG